jgi:hypothetical protein
LARAALVETTRWVTVMVTWKGLPAWLALVQQQLQQSIMQCHVPLLPVIVILSSPP